MNLKLRRPLLGILGAIAAFGGALGFANLADKEASAVHAADFEGTKISSVADLSSGVSAYLYSPNRKEGFSKTSGKWGLGSTDQSLWALWTLTPSGEGFTASYDDNGTTTYLNISNSDNAWAVSTTKKSVYYFATIGNNDGFVVPQKTGYSKVLLYNANGGQSTCGFRCGSTSSANQNNDNQYSDAFFYLAEPPKAMTGISVSGDFKTEYLEDEYLDLDGMVVTAAYEDGSTKILAETDYEVEPSLYSPLKVSDNLVTVSYDYMGETYSDSFDIQVRERALLGIEITSEPKTEYFVNDEFDPTGFEVTAHYEGQKDVIVTDDVHYEEPDLTTAGSKVVTVKYGEFEDTFTVNVKERVVESLSLTGKKTSFNNGDTFTLGPSAKLVATWNYGKEEDLSLDSEGVVVKLMPSLDASDEEIRVIDSSYVLTLEDDQSYVSIEYKGSKINRYQISVREVLDITKGSFVLVEDINQISVGDSVLIVASKSGKYYAISSLQNNNNRGQAEVKIEDDGSIILDDELSLENPPEIIKIVDGYIDGTFGFEVSAGFLDIHANNNRLTSTDGITKNSSWTIGIDTSDEMHPATITSCAYTSRELRYNSSSSLFACYTSGQNDVYIYKFEKSLTDGQVVQSFVDGYMHLTDYNENEGLCAGEGGYYALAKEALLKLTDSQIELFKTSDEFKDARDRYIAWSIANGDTDPYGETGVAGIVRSPAAEVPEKSIALSAVLGVGLAAIAAGSAFIIKRRREGR